MIKLKIFNIETIQYYVPPNGENSSTLLPWYA